VEPGTRSEKSFFEMTSNHFEHSRKSDVLEVAGSSLVLTPAAEMPREALMERDFASNKKMI